MGLGVTVPEGRKDQKQAEMLDVKGMRKWDAQDKKKRARLEHMFYASEDVEKYLGGG